VNKKQLIAIHDKLAEDYSEVKAYRNDLGKVHKVLSNEKEAKVIGNKITNTTKLMSYLEKMIKYTRAFIMHLNFQKKKTDFYNQGLVTIVSKLEKMRTKFNDSKGDGVTNKVELEEMKARIHKLAELYKYLRKDAFHDYVRSQIMKRVINLNLSLLSSEDLKKHLSVMKMKKSLLGKS